MLQKIFYKIVNKIENERDSKKIFWRFFVFVKDFFSKSIDVLQNASYFIPCYIKYLVLFKRGKKKYYLSVLAILKNENPWLKEWIEYHKLIGVEHFYLYNNDDDTAESDAVLAPYVKTGIVENIHFPGRVRQIPAYKNGIKIARPESEWLAIIDLDEFIYPLKEDNLKSILRNYEKYAGLVVNFHCFGSSGLIKRPPNQINNFLHRAEKNFLNNRLVKSIVRPSLVIINGTVGAHYCCYFKSFAVDEKMKRVDGRLNKVTSDIIRINHYATRSLYDFTEIKMKTGRPDIPVNNRDMDYFKCLDRNEVFDDGICKRFGRVLY